MVEGAAGPLPLLAACSQEVFEHLFADSPSCYAVFSLLPPLAKHHVMRLLFVDDPVPAPAVVKFVSAQANGGPEHTDALRALHDVRVWAGGAGDSVSLNPAFRAGLRPVVAGGGAAWVGSEGRKGGRAERMDPAELERWGIEQWERVLRFMVQDEGSARGADATVVSTLFEAGLLRGVPGAHNVTKPGFQFLLQPRRAQLWRYLIEYLKQPVFDGAPKQAAALSMLFRLSFSQAGEAYPAAALTELQRGMLGHLSKLGLVRQGEKDADALYYPTGLASLLMRAPSASDEGGHVGYLVVETNFRVFALDPTDLQVALLGKFVEMQYRFPNMVVGTMTRESVRGALDNGITADQIARYLQSHVHPRMEPVPGTPWSPLPRAVSDQLFLWQWETERVTSRPAKLYTDFSDDADYADTFAYCRREGILLAQGVRAKRMAVAEEGHARVKRWREEQRSAAAER